MRHGVSSRTTSYSIRRTARRILCDAGQLAVVGGVIALGAALVAALWDRDMQVALVFGLSGLGQLALFGVCRSLAPKEVNPYSTASAIALGWLLVAVVSAGPLWIVGGTRAVAVSYATIDGALFESMSAFTSTGLSLATVEPGLPHSIQLWRSLAQWAGGLGMVFFALMVIKSKGRSRDLVTQEMDDHALGDDVDASVVTILTAYATITVVTMVGFVVTGMPWWEAINHGLTAVSTGGMTLTSASFSDYGTGPKLVAMGAMLAGAVSFSVYALALRERKPSAIYRSTQVRALLTILVGGGLMLMAALHHAGASVAPLDVAFEWVSAVTTCGFSAVTLNEWPTLPLALVIGAMIVGASAGSTAGGIKLARIQWLLKRVQHWLLHEAAPVPDVDDPTYTWDGKEVSEEDADDNVAEAGVMATVWLMTLGVSIPIIAALEGDASWRAIMFDATSALGGVGLSAGLVSSELAPSTKVVMSIMMWLGRLEIVSVFALFLSPVAMTRRRMSTSG